MRKFINLITENTRPEMAPERSSARPTKTKTDDLSSLTDLGGGEHTGSIAPVGGTHVAAHRAHNVATADGSATTRAWANSNAAAISARMVRSGEAENMLRGFEALAADEDEISDEEAQANSNFDINVGMAALGAAHADVPALAHPEGYLERTPDNLPVVIQQSLRAHGDPDIDQTFDPEWHQVKNLPGYLQGAIRQVARSVFREFTTTPIENINMLCDMLNPPADVRKMAELIARYGVAETDPTFDWHEHMPAYSQIAGPTAETRLYRCAGYQFVIMRDTGGNYIYGWPADDGRIVNQNQAAQLPPA